MANLEITLKFKDGAFCATVDDVHKRVRRSEHIKWRVAQPEPPEFPPTYVVSVDFPSDRDPLAGGAHGHHKGRRQADHHVSDNVAFVNDGSYPYVISYVDDHGAIHPMKDPELVVDGGPNRDPKPKKKKKKSAAKSVTRPRARKSAKKKPAKTAGKRAKKAKTAKKAQLSMKRKAKKR